MIGDRDWVVVSQFRYVTDALVIDSKEACHGKALIKNVTNWLTHTIVNRN